MRKLKDATVELQTHMTSLFIEDKRFDRTPVSHSKTHTVPDKATVDNSRWDGVTLRV